MEITRDTFVSLPVENKMDVIYDILTEQRADQKRLEAEMGKCNDEMARRKRVDTTVAGTMGFLGGVIGFFTHKLLFK